MVPLGAREGVAVAAQLPFHLLLALGLWRGGRALGGREGGGLALALGLLAVGASAESSSALLDLPLAACAVLAGGTLLEGRPGGALLAGAGAAWTKLAAGPTLLPLALDALATAWGAAQRPWRAFGLAALLLLVGYGSGLGALLGGYVGESGNVAPALHGWAASGARLGMLAGSALEALQVPMLVLVVACLLAARGLRPLAWGLGGMVALSLLTLTPQPRYLLALVAFASMAAAALVGEGRRVRALAWTCACAMLLSVALRDAGMRVPWSLVRAPPASLAPELERSLTDTLRALDDRARADGRSAGDRAVVALQLPDVPPLTAGMAAWIVAREDLALLPLPARKGYPLREDADLALVVQCGASPSLGTARTPDHRELWPGGCAASVWTASPRPEGVRSREAR
jgi:hypothetical protein